MLQLRGDASARRFWRVTLDSRNAPPSAIVVDLGPDDLPRYAKILKLLPEPLPEPPFLNVHRFLSSVGVAVPKVYRAMAGERLLMVEDVGDVEMLQAAKDDPARTLSLYKLALDELILFHVDATRRRGGCLAFQLAYDARLFAWEMEQFLTHGLRIVAPRTSPEDLKPELDELAARLGAMPRVLSHRDYHGQNLFLQGDGRTIVRVLDFQDALMAPAAQDLSVLMTTRDTETVINPHLETELLEYYASAIERRSGERCDRSQLNESYRLCVLQHALKVIGRFIYLESTGKQGYSIYVPNCISQARRMLAGGNDFPLLRQALESGAGSSP